MFAATTLVLSATLISSPPGHDPATPIPAATAAPERDTRIRAAIVDVAERQQLVGYSAAVRQRGELIYRECFGLADLEHEVPVHENTRFLIASVTKSFTGMAVLQLVERGMIDLDAPIQTYVPTFPEKPEGVITPRMLLRTSGTPRLAR